LKLSLDAYLSDVASRQLSNDEVLLMMLATTRLGIAEVIEKREQDVAGLVAVVRAVRNLVDGRPDYRNALSEYVRGFHHALDLIEVAMESAVPGSESQNDDEAGVKP
jgi:hypothetical protein